MASPTTWRVRCRVSGGVTGTRSALLKTDTGDVAEFATREAAQARCDELVKRMNHGRSWADFAYWPEEWSA